MDIGKRLKQLRTKNDLTLEDLASRCELSKGFLSQLERNLTSPSISTLEDIVEVLGITLKDFFTEETQNKVVYHKEDFYIDERDNYSITWLVPDSQKNALDPIILKLNEDGQSQTLAPYDGEEFGLVLKGKVDLYDETSSKVYHLKKGDTFYLKGNCTHYLKSRGGETEVLWISTPAIL